VFGFFSVIMKNKGGDCAAFILKGVVNYYSINEWLSRLLPLFPALATA